MPGLSNANSIYFKQQPTLLQREKLEFWYDASDAATITESAGYVLQVDDRSSRNGFIYQDIGSSQPQYILAGQNTLNIIRFVNPDRNVVGDYMLSKNFGYTLFQPVTFVSVFKRNNLTATGSVLYDGKQHKNRIASLNSPNGKAYLFAGKDVFESTGTDAGAFQILVECFDSTSSFARRNGTPLTLGSTDVGSMPAWGLTIGAIYSNNTFGFDGDFGDFLAISKRLTTSEIEEIEGHLAHKWGIQANLPDSHPYKSAPPVGYDLLSKWN